MMIDSRSMMLLMLVFIYHVSCQHDIDFIRKPKSFTLFRDEESAVPTPEDPDGDGVIGTAGKHYPVLKSAPLTSFECDGRLPGMYADMEAGCQVYHICQADMRKESALCVNGTLFNQATFSCDWWYNVECQASEKFYSLNADLGRQPSNEHHRKGMVEFPPSEVNFKKPQAMPPFKFEDVPRPPFPPPPPRQRPIKKIRPSDISPPQQILFEVIPSRIPSPPKPNHEDIMPPPPSRPRPIPNFEVPRLRRPRPFDGDDQNRHLHSDSFKKVEASRFKPGSADGQYDRNVFNPAIHLPRRKFLPDKKLPKVSDVPAHLKPVRPPQMHPVKSDDVVSGYSDLYLNKPVDED